MDRFSRRMALVELTGSVAAWAKGLAKGLEKVGRSDSADLFSVSPPFASAGSGADGYDELHEYVQARMTALADLLAGSG